MKKAKKVLITGGSGTIGSRLTTLLQERGYEVSHLTRSARKASVMTYIWDPASGSIDSAALNEVDAIVHLAGAGIADKRWSEKRKNEILSSRTESTKLLSETLRSIPNQVKVFVSASGISYYGLDRPRHHAFVETDPPASDFMAQVTVAWEKSVSEIDHPAIRTAMIRTGVVLSNESGALKKLVMPVRFLVGAPLGSGDQYFNWIHIDDLCRLYVKAIEDPSTRGVYNAVAPNPVTNKELTRTIARVLKKPLWLPPIPAFVVRAIAGEVSELVLKGGKISSEKTERSGFEFQFRTIDKALNDLLA